MNPDSLFWLMIGAVLATCFLSLGARCLRHFSRHNLEEICRRRKVKAYFGEILRRHDSVAVAVELLSTLTAALTVIAALLWVSMRQAPPVRPEGVGWMGVLAATLALGVMLSAAMIWLPRAVARLFAEQLLFHTWRAWKLCAVFATPLVWGARFVDVLVHRMAGRAPEPPNEDTFEEEIRTIVTEGHREGLLEEDAREMIESVIDLGDADVAEIMTPRTDMHMLQADIPTESLVADVIASGHTRIPVFGDNRDDIIGVLYSKDLLPELAKSPDEVRKSLRELMRDPLFVPATKAVDDLLEMFQHTHTHIAIVLDEYGGVAGLVTIEDVLEEIVGEIVDEYDEDVVEEIQRIDDYTWEVVGRTHVDEVNDELDLELPDDGDFDTIAGFVFSELGRVPQNGESVVWEDRARITVLEATHRRIDRVRIKKIDVESREIA